MRKLMMATLLALTMLMASAKVGDMSLGVQFNYASKNSMFGLGLNYEIEVLRNVRVEPEFIYFFENKHLSDYNVNLNLHYMIPTSSAATIYPLAGFSFVSFKDHEFNTTTNRCGANVGLGFEYSINTNFTFYTEQRFHIIKDWNEGVTSLGLRYRF